jgi:hypothetical protein
LAGRWQPVEHTQSAASTEEERKYTVLVLTGFWLAASSQKTTQSAVCTRGDKLFSIGAYWLLAFGHTELSASNQRGYLYTVEYWGEQVFKNQATSIAGKLYYESPFL